MQQCILQLGAVVVLLSNLLNANTPAATQTPESQNTVQAVVSSTQIEATVTKYSGIESCSDSNCTMASGKKAYIGAVACPREYKLGIKVRIEGSIYTCEDRTASKYNGRFDIFAGFNTEAHREAIEWGKRKIKIEILD